MEEPSSFLFFFFLASSTKLPCGGPSLGTHHSLTSTDASHLSLNSNHHFPHNHSYLLSAYLICSILISRRKWVVQAEGTGKIRDTPAWSSECFRLGPHCVSQPAHSLTTWDLARIPLDGGSAIFGPLYNHGRKQILPGKGKYEKGGKTIVVRMELYMMMLEKWLCLN